jgi:hypothetical protein
MANFRRRFRRTDSTTRSARYIAATAASKLGELDALRLQLALVPPPRGLTRARRYAAIKRVRWLETAAAANADAVTPKQFLDPIGVNLTPAQRGLVAVAAAKAAAEAEVAS